MESVGMEGDADDRLLLDRRGRGAAQAFREKGLRIFDMSQSSRSDSDEFMTKYERALLRSSAKTALCVPIFSDQDAWGMEDEQARPEPSGIVSIDSDEDLFREFEDPDVTDALVQMSSVLYELVSKEVEHG
jgi:hypothetical protein